MSRWWDDFFLSPEARAQRRYADGWERIWGNARAGEPAPECKCEPDTVYLNRRGDPSSVNPTCPQHGWEKR